MTRIDKLLSLLSSAYNYTFKWRCIKCGITLENNGTPLRCPTCKDPMMAI